MINRVMNGGDFLINLMMMLIERVGLIIILAFFLVNIPQFRRLLFRTDTVTKVELIVIFSLFTIIANLIGIEISPNNDTDVTPLLLNVSPGDSVANIRILTVTVSGIIGGPFVGSVVGMVAGVHRILQESFTLDALFYLPSSIIIGFLSGLFSIQKQHHFAIMKAWQGFLIGLLMESIQMIFILIFSPTGWTLVKYIAIPMITIGALGTSVFLSIISLYFRQEVDVQAAQTKTVLQLALRTLPEFRQGLNKTAAKKVVELILKYTSFEAAGISNEHKILAFAGTGQDHHIAGQEIKTSLSEKAINSGEVQIGNNAKEINCKVPNCPLHSAIVVPLVAQNKIVGSLKLYHTEQWKLSPVEIQLGTGLGEILAMQIMLGEMEKQSNLVRDAEIKSLQAQVNPHFFFNAINTISAVMRINSDQARSLLLQLSTYFRSNLLGVRETVIPLAKEFEHVKAYLSLEQTRFPDKYEINFNNTVDENVMIPPFSIQILVENAIKHAFSKSKTNNVVSIRVARIKDKLELRVADNGSGIDKEIIGKIGKDAISSKKGSGTALQNLSARLSGLYGSDGELKVDSDHYGTVVRVVIPYMEKGEGEK
ncbi:membrane signal transduction histidine kinase [Pediococcus stilesii]|uniref:histidine kinase n=1 Tax=Pediococcus stilesii TaxID=331679 RepID=A0A0R2KYT3_9LACO|nr:membrane signal transduction histidine kinase [Pediococcus stilesii]